MSVKIETIITCEGNCIPECQGVYLDGDSRSFSAKRQRQDFRANGWAYIDSKDYCPVCTKIMFPDRHYRVKI